MTRNAVVVSPHPLAREVSADAAHHLARAAVEAGAPDGCVQVVEEPTIPLIEALMSDPTTDVILATGGVAVVRAAYRSGNPAIGVGPGNVPALVDHTADLAAAAERLIDSKSFDNSILCTNESCAIVEERCADAFERELAATAATCSGPTTWRPCARSSTPRGALRLDLIGRTRQTLADEAGIRVPPKTRVLVAPFPLVVPEEPLAREKLFPRARARARARCAPRHRCGLRDAAHRRRRPLGGDPLPRPAHDHGLRRGGAGAAGGGQRRRQHRLGRPRHEPGADDDDRHRASSAARRWARTSSRAT